MTVSLTTQQQTFIEQFTMLNTTIGVSKNTMRLLAYLIVCDTPEQTTKDLMRNLTLSAGSVSTSLGLLVDAGILQRIKHKGIRQPSYRVHPDGWNRAVNQRIKSIHAMALFSDAALQSYPQNQRVAAMRDVYVRFDQHLQKLPKQ